MLRIKLRYDDVEAMAQRFAANIGKSGLFVPTKSLQPVGAEVKFELRLANDTPVITGLGKVREARAADPANPRAAFGMAIELLRVTRESRDVILKLLERRKQLGLPDVAIPSPDDIDAARRGESETNAGSAPKEPAAARRAEPDSNAGSAPKHPSVPRDSAPIGGDSGLAFTSPRRPTGPIAVAKVHAVAPLAPEPPRKRRAPVHELIESASGRIVAVTTPGLDENVDVAAVLARARMLATGDLDAELEALRESSAAPIVEITVEAASAELARQLGGKPVSRDRSARWATPPHPVAEGTPAPMPVILATPGPMPIVEAAAATPRMPVVEATPAPMPIVDAVPVIEAAPTMVETQAPVGEPFPTIEAAPTMVEPPAPVVESAPVIDVASLLESSPEIDVAPVRESAPAIDADQILESSPAIEVDQILESSPAIAPAMIVDSAPGIHVSAIVESAAAIDAASLRESSPAIEVSSRLATSPVIEADQILESSPAIEVDQILESSPALAVDPAQQLDDGSFDAAEHTQVGEDPDRAAFDNHAYATDPSGGELERSLERQLADVDDDDLGIPAEHAVHVRAESLAEELDPDELEEIDDFEIVHEANDADAEQLATASDEDIAREPAAQVASAAPAVAATPVAAPAVIRGPEPRHSDSDFASRLDLGDDDDELPPAKPEPGRRVRSLAEIDTSTGELDPMQVSAAHAIAAFDDDAEPAPAKPRAATADVRSTRESIHGFDDSDLNSPSVVPARPRRESVRVQPEPPARARRESVRVQPPPAKAPDPDVDNLDLETALEALDVDLDDLAMPHAKTEIPRRSAAVAALPRKHPRAASEDGIMIDFDDDE